MADSGQNRQGIAISIFASLFAAVSYWWWVKKSRAGDDRNPLSADRPVGDGRTRVFVFLDLAPCRSRSRADIRRVKSRCGIRFLAQLKLRLKRPGGGNATTLEIRTPHCTVSNFTEKIFCRQRLVINLIVHRPETFAPGSTSRRTSAFSESAHQFSPQTSDHARQKVHVTVSIRGMPKIPHRGLRKYSPAWSPMLQIVVDAR